MRLSPNQRAAVDAACEVIRPDARLVRVRDQWAAVWHIATDPQIPGAVVPRAERWRAQLLSRVNGAEVWWSGIEHVAATRRGVIAGLLAEVRS